MEVLENFGKRSHSPTGRRRWVANASRMLHKPWFILVAREEMPEGKYHRVRNLKQQRPFRRREWERYQRFQPADQRI